MSFVSAFDIAKTSSSNFISIFNGGGRSKVVPPPTIESDFRCSRIPHLCPREEVICALNNIERTEVVPSDLLLIFNIGTYYHKMVQNEYWQDILLGKWKCQQCATIFGTDKKWVFKPKNCKRCNCDSFEYEEIFVEDKEFMLHGHPDGIISSDGKRYLAEIKTINSVWFQRLAGPLHDHLVQFNLYMHMTKIFIGKILYINKAATGIKDCFKEYDVTLDKKILDEGLNKIRIIKEGIKNQMLPEERICHTDIAPRAKKCSVRDRCFADRVRVWGIN